MGAAIPYRIFLFLVGAAACSGDLTLPGDGSTAILTVVSGNRQEGTVGDKLDQPLVVRLTDSRSQPVVGIPVLFSFESGTPEARIYSPQAETDSNGEAQAEVRLGTDAGTHIVEAAAAELRATFDLNALEREKGKGGKGRGEDSDDDDEDSDDEEEDD